MRPPDNEQVAQVLEEVADLLSAQHADAYRVRAYREAAATLRDRTESAEAVLERDGRAGLERWPTIGKSLSAAISEILHTGRLGLLDRLRGEISPEDLFTTVPGIGEELARRLHQALGLETLEDLEVAAHDGRLESLPGFGPRRTRAIRELLATRLSRSARRRARRIRDAEHASETPAERPSVELVLELDAEYRRRAEAGELRTIAPRRFNPEHRSWLPVLHSDREGFSFTALYSNTARAHELGTTHDWVILYYERDGHEDQCTVVTEHRGPLAGRRVVRGRERECQDHYG